jgi:hypothetical protein
MISDWTFLGEKQQKQTIIEGHINQFLVLYQLLIENKVNGYLLWLEFDPLLYGIV